jgi:large subunit ribosomal protein L22
VKHIRISPKKANVVVGIIRGKKVGEAIDFLKVANKKAADVLGEVVKSAVANAKNNDGKRAENLIVKTAFVTKGRTLRRGVSGSRGRVNPIKKRSSHIFVELSEIETEKPETPKKSAEKPAKKS